MKKDQQFCYCRSVCGNSAYRLLHGKRGVTNGKDSEVNVKKEVKDREV